MLISCFGRGIMVDIQRIPFFMSLTALACLEGKPPHTTLLVWYGFHFCLDQYLGVEFACVTLVCSIFRSAQIAICHSQHFVRLKNETNSQFWLIQIW
jgi:hypothetical protein